MSRILIKNIRSLVQVEETPGAPVAGAAMKNLPVIENAWLAIEDDLIAAFGSMDDFPGITDWSGLQVIDANDESLVLPCWCDSHTHIVYAGSREGEFVDRINGLTYQEIAQRGGGILNSAAKLASASEDELVAGALQRIREIMAQGTGAVEIKSGYGLSLETELKMLRVIRRLKTESPIPVKATFLGAHAVPKTHTKEAYIDCIINEMLPAVAAENLADFCDVFCEANYFSKAETISILEAAKKHGLVPKVHAEQLSHAGGVEAGVETGAISVDHLEYVDANDIVLLKNSKTIPVVLPGAQFFLSLINPPARQMIDSGLPLAIASDYNPGSSPSGNMHLMLSLACVNYKITPAEAITAATINGAHAMGIGATHGSICVGKKANVFITKPINGFDFIPYAFGSDLVQMVIIDGKILVEKG